MIAEKAEDLQAGVARAAESIDHGAATDALSKLVAITNEAL